MKQSARKNQKQNFSRNSNIKSAKNNCNFAKLRNDQIRDSCNYLRRMKVVSLKLKTYSLKFDKEVLQFINVQKEENTEVNATKSHCRS